MSDINEAFDKIILSEKQINQEGYDEGFLKGTKDGNSEGFHLGYHRGSELGAELGYYLGVVDVLMYAQTLTAKPSDKALKHLRTITNLINNFPKTNDDNVELIEALEIIRGRFKITCSFFKIKGTYPFSDKMDF